MATPSTADPANPFRYGWRDVASRAPDGTITWDRVPLTLADVLHPQMGDTLVHAEPHERRCTYLYDVFRAQLADDPTAVVLHDVGIEWDAPNLKPHSPDLSVILGVRERQAWTTFNVAREGVRPALIVEVTSPDTAHLDRSTRVTQYNRVQVPLYVIVDTVTRRGQARLRLLGYERVGGVYQRLAPNAQGWLWLEPVRVWLGIADDEIACYDEAGTLLGDYVALAATIADLEAARAEAERMATVERQARLEAEARLRAMAEEINRLRGH